MLWPFMASSNQLQLNKNCSMKVLKNKLTVPTNTCWTILQIVGPNENYIIHSEESQQAFGFFFLVL